MGTIALLEENIVVSVTIEGWVKIDEVDGSIPYVPSEYLQVIPIVEEVARFIHLLAVGSTIVMNIYKVSWGGE